MRVHGASETFEAIVTKDHAGGERIRPAIWPAPVLFKGDDMAFDILGVASPHWQLYQPGPASHAAGPSCGWLIRMPENENPEPGAGKRLVRGYAKNMTGLGRTQVTRLRGQFGAWAAWIGNQ